jgi:hypothetical protein
MAKILPDGRIEFSDGRILEPREPFHPDDRIDLTREIAHGSEDALRRILAACRLGIVQRGIGIVGRLGTATANLWFTVRPDRYNDRSVTANLVLSVCVPLVRVHLSVLAEDLPEVVWQKHCRIGEESVRNMLAGVDPAALEEPLAQAIVKRLAPASPKHWMPVRRIPR